MRTVNYANIGVGPAYENIHIGSDGQLWRWDNGQIGVATSGDDAVQYALEHKWPERLVGVLRTKMK